VRTHPVEKLLEQHCYKAAAGLLQLARLYTRKNAQVVTGLQTSCYKSVHKLSTSCLRLFPVVGTSLEQAVNNL
jgi:hypothetical protein